MFDYFKIGKFYLRVVFIFRRLTVRRNAVLWWAYHRCEWNTCSRKFLMAVALVVTGEGNKASRWMLQAAEGISREELLMSLVSRNCNENEITDVTLRYYLICVQLLQQTGLSIAALHVALVALNSAVDSDPLLPTMWSIVAVLHLHLGHYQVRMYCSQMCRSLSNQLKGVLVLV